MSALLCSPAADITRPPPGTRTTPGSNGKASATVGGRPGSSLAVCAGISLGADAPCSNELLGGLRRDLVGRRRALLQRIDRSLDFDALLPCQRRRERQLNRGWYFEIGLLDG